MWLKCLELSHRQICDEICYISSNSLLPLGATALVESWVDKVEGRKVYALAELRSPDGKVFYSSASALFIQLQPQGENADKWKNSFSDKK